MNDIKFFSGMAAADLRSSFQTRSPIDCLRFVGTTEIDVLKPVVPSSELSLDVDYKFDKVLVDDNDLWKGKVKLSRHIITKGAQDYDIRCHLPKNHIFSASMFCQVVIALKKEKSGDLVGNDFANLMYVADKNKDRVLVVDLRLSRGVWYMLSLGQMSQLWSVGFQVLSPT